MKKVHTTLLIFGVLSIWISGCKKVSNGPNDIRIQNISEFTYTEVFVDTSEGQHQYGTIAAGATSEYKWFKFAYNEAHIRCRIDGELYKTDTVNFTALVPLPAGYVTYTVDADTANKKLIMDVSEINPY